MCVLGKVTSAFALATFTNTLSLTNRKKTDPKTNYSVAYYLRLR